jgi:hypothetical protein
VIARFLPEARSYAQTLSLGPRSLIYGDDQNVRLWPDWFSARPGLERWRSRLLGPFGDVYVALFEAP